MTFLLATFRPAGGADIEQRLAPREFVAKRSQQNLHELFIEVVQDPHRQKKRGIGAAKLGQPVLREHRAGDGFRPGAFVDELAPQADHIGKIEIVPTDAAVVDARKGGVEAAPKVDNGCIRMVLEIRAKGAVGVQGACDPGGASLR